MGRGETREWRTTLYVGKSQQELTCENLLVARTTGRFRCVPRPDRSKCSRAEASAPKEGGAERESRGPGAQVFRPQTHLVKDQQLVPSRW